MVQLNFDLTGMTDEIVRAVKESLKANHDTTAGGIVITAKQIGEGVGEAIFQFIAGALETAVEELGNGLAEKLQNGGVPDIAAMREQILAIQYLKLRSFQVEYSATQMPQLHLVSQPSGSSGVTAAVIFFEFIRAPGYPLSRACINGHYKKTVLLSMQDEFDGCPTELDAMRRLLRISGYAMEAEDAPLRSERDHHNKVVDHLCQRQLRLS